jgi:endonuclease/exonuclease/phosphatase family metal-dependent hydrolase
MLMRIGTYNIHRSIGRGGIKDFKLTSEVINNINADVIALQEVAYDFSADNNELTSLAQAAGARAIPGPTLLDRKDLYGNAVLSRRKDISFKKQEPRGVIEVIYDIEDVRLKIVATHLGLKSNERNYQLREILSFMDKGFADITVLLGDFNEWFPWSHNLRSVYRRFGNAGSPATFPGFFPVLSLDRIFVYPGERLVSLNKIRSHPAGIASDHLPLAAEIDIS